MAVEGKVEKSGKEENIVEPKEEPVKKRLLKLGPRVKKRKTQ